MLILIMEVQRINGGAESLLEKKKNGMRGSVVLSNSNNRSIKILIYKDYYFTLIDISSSELIGQNDWY